MKKLFVNLDNIIGTAYWTFAPGNWDGKNYWCKDGIFIHDNDMFPSGFIDVVLYVIPNCDPLGETKISKEQWTKIYEKAVLEGGITEQLVQAAEPWITENFQKYDAFYILGV